MNVPEASLAVYLDSDMKKVTEVAETKINNACKYIIECEDHTLGNLMRMDMLEDERVSFVGYRVPHPLKNSIEYRVQTSDPAYKPNDAMIASCNRLINLMDVLDNDILIFETKNSKEQEDHLY